MFTGIVTHQAKILRIHEGVFTIQKPQDIVVQFGQSIAHDGACMSITKITDETYSFFAMEETMRKTNFGQKKEGDLFNLEFSLHLSSLLDGHIVTGHIDTPGKVTDTQMAPDGSKMLQINYSQARDAHVIEKGSIALNGVSLTVVTTGTGRCSVRLIPLTQTVTNLGSVAKGSVLNIEFDMLGKYVLNYLKKQQSI